MKAEEGEKRVGKDAVFQGPREPRRIPAGEHNDQAWMLLPELADQGVQFRAKAVMSA